MCIIKWTFFKAACLRVHSFETSSEKPRGPGYQDSGWGHASPLPPPLEAPLIVTDVGHISKWGSGVSLPLPPGKIFVIWQILCLKSIQKLYFKIPPERRSTLTNEKTGGTKFLFKKLWNAVTRVLPRFNLWLRMSQYYNRYDEFKGPCTPLNLQPRALYYPTQRQTFAKMQTLP